MQKKQNDTTLSNIWQSVTSLAEEPEQDIPVTKPRTTARQIYQSNTPALTAEDYWHLNPLLIN